MDSINPGNNFTVIPNTTAQDTTLTMQQKGLLFTILSLPEEWDFNEENLAKILPDEKSEITSALRGLEKKGYLKRIKSEDNSYNWEIYATPLKISGDKV